MTDAWSTVPLGELCSIQSGKSDTKDAVSDGPYAFFDRSKTIKRSSRFLRDCEALIIPGEGTEFLPRHFSGKFDLHQRAYALFDFSPELDARFLYHYLHYSADYFPKVAVGATVKSLRRRHFEELPVRLTKRSEQQRIVAILDEGFDGITTAKANAEKNLQNSRELFESHLQSVFTQRGKGWKGKTLEEISTAFGRGKSKHRPRNDPALYGGKYPFIQTGDVRNAGHFITEFSQTYSEAGLAQSKLWPKGTICITIAANIAETGILAFDACFPDSVIGVVPNPAEAEIGFVEYLLQSFKVRIQAMGQGSAQANINMGTFENERFPFPDIAEQRQIVARLDALSEETQHLESIYQQKLAALAELKKSLLHQAFTGQLTAAKPTLAVRRRELQTTTPQFAANVISLAYARHAKKQRERTFGRVKEQKLLHLVEAIGKIDLGRQPMKDAAGPNDFRHMLKAEDWARTQDFFEMVDRGNGYDFKKLKNFDKRLSKAKQELQPYLSSIEKVTDLLIPMDSEEAGIFATVHAAWNNLLIDGVEATDGAILKEARETWHADKLSIPEHKFKKAIEFIRRNGLIPDGTGKYVAGQTSLL